MFLHDKKGKTTTDATIRKSIEERGGVSVRVSANHEGDDPGALGVDFSGFSEPVHLR